MVPDIIDVNGLNIVVMGPTHEVIVEATKCGRLHCFF